MHGPQLRKKTDDFSALWLETSQSPGGAWLRGHLESPGFPELAQSPFLGNLSLSILTPKTPGSELCPYKGPPHQGPTRVHNPGPVCRQHPPWGCCSGGWGDSVPWSKSCGRGGFSLLPHEPLALASLRPSPDPLLCTNGEEGRLSGWKPRRPTPFLHPPLVFNY